MENLEVMVVLFIIVAIISIIQVSISKKKEVN